MPGKIASRSWHIDASRGSTVDKGSRLKNTRRNALNSIFLAFTISSLTACQGTEERHLPEPVELKGEAIPASTLDKKPLVKMNLNEQTAHARTDLAKRLRVNVESVVLASARAVTWRSGALGCPKPGMNYTDALVPGSLIFLRVGNMFHAYHATRDGLPFYCPHDRVEQPVLDQTQDVT
jgi:hypothetical protein